MSQPDTKVNRFIAKQFLSTFDLDIHYLPSKTIHILDYPSRENDFQQLKLSFEKLAQAENIDDVEIRSTIENEPAAKLIFLFLSNPKDLSTKVSHLTTYTSSESPVIWVLVRDKYYPRTKEKVPAIWEPLTNAQYYEVRPTIRIGNEKWIGTRFSIGRQSGYDAIQNNDIHIALPLSPEAQKRRTSALQS